MFKRRAETGDARRLKELEAQVSALELATAVCEFSMDGQVLRANDNFLKMLGYGAAELAGRSHASLVGPPAEAADQRELWARLHRGEHAPGKYCFLSKSGEPRWLRAAFAAHAERAEVEVSVSGEAFLTEPGGMVERLRGAVAAATGIEPRLDTGGGTSDARFIARHCPVAEFGLVGATMHQADERVPVEEMRALARIYQGVLASFLGA